MQVKTEQHFPYCCLDLESKGVWVSIKVKSNGHCWGVLCPLPSQGRNFVSLTNREEWLVDFCWPSQVGLNKKGELIAAFGQIELFGVLGKRRFYGVIRTEVR